MLREIVLDTETTGLDSKKGDRLVELACIELVNRIPTGREFHTYLNPEDREVHPDAEAVHGISSAFLKDKPVFSAVVDEFLRFIDGSALVIHNAGFDIAFINMELQRSGRPPLTMDRVIDTLALARRKHPAGPNSLDALCKRYGIDNSKRTKHGALTDSALLAEVYVELLGERQAALVLSKEDEPPNGLKTRTRPTAARRTHPLPSRLTAEDVTRHRTFVETLGGNPLWKRYFSGTEGTSGIEG
jgi:DNA polymerase-3 subunit epsilon